MTSSLAESSLADLVTARPGRSRVFETFGLDYCCKGKMSLEKACSLTAQDLDEVLEKLAAFDASADDHEEPDCASMSLTQLTQHLVTTHHAFLKEELPALRQLIDKVTRVHGRSFPWLSEVKQVAGALFQELDAHLQKEEQILFPMICEMEQATSTPSFHCGSVETPIRVMEMEHDNVGGVLARLRALTSGYTVPPEGCNSFRAMMDRLAALEYDLHRHIHKENSLLHPQALALAEKLGC